jgi:DNA replication protein DnaC
MSRRVPKWESTSLFNDFLVELRGFEPLTSAVRLHLDDLAYVTKDQAETSVLFELISARYERRSMLITANQPFGEWGKIFPGHSFS